MNPFTESTVARPLTDPSATHPATRPELKAQPKRSPSNTAGCPGSASGLSAPSRADPSLRRKIAFSLLHRMAGAAGVLGLAGGIGLLAVPCAAYALDVNAATQAQLEAIRGLGPKTAQIIIQERTRGGQYESFQDLSDRVKGIGPKKAASLQASGLTMGKEAAANLATSAKPVSSTPAPRSAK